MWILVTIHASITWACLDNIYIRHGETRAMEITMILNQPVQGQLVVNAVVTFISLVLADMTMVSVRTLIFSVSLREYII